MATHGTPARGPGEPAVMASGPAGPDRTDGPMVVHVLDPKQPPYVFKNVLSRSAACSRSIRNSPAEPSDASDAA